MTKEESDLIIAEQNRSKDEILKAVAKVKSYYHELCNLKDTRIEELEEENAKLKERNAELAGQKASLQRWLGEATAIIKGLLDSCFGPTSKTVNYEIKARAEQFLKEVKE